MKWVTMWGNAQSAVLPSPAIYAKDVTLRYPIFIPFSGEKVSITLDNFCCDEDVKISSLRIAIGNALSDTQEGIPYDLTVQGEKEFCIKAHESVKTDPLDISLESEKFLIISIYLKDYTNLTSGVDILGPLSKGYFAYGDQSHQTSLDINTSKGTSWVYFLANVDIYTTDDKEAIICYGDSITSQHWPDYLLLALRNEGYNNYSVVRKAVSGTRVLREYECITYQSYGKSGTHRFCHEIGSVAGATKLIIQHGINDIIHPVGKDVNIFRPMSDYPSSEELLEGLKAYERQAEAFHLRTYFGTLLPIYGWRTFAPFREDLKNEINQWIRSRNSIDFAKEVGYFDGKFEHFKDLCDSGDHLHPSKYAYELMGKLAAKCILGRNL